MNNCSCIYVSEWDNPEFFNQKKVKARKEHICGECGRTILKGEEYERFSGNWKNEGFCCYKTCEDCLSVRDAFFCDGWIFGEVIEGVDEHIREVDGKISIDCLEELTPAARDRVLAECELVREER